MMIPITLYDTDPDVTAIFEEIVGKDPGLGPIETVHDLPGLRKAISQQMRSVVVLGPELIDEDLPDFPLMSQDYSGVAFVQVADAADATVLKRAMRSGIRDVVAVDEAETDLAASIKRAHAMVEAEMRPLVAPDAGDEGHVVTIFGVKGGTGKTVVATNLAVLAAQSGISTVLLDANVAVGDCGALLRVRPDKNILDLAGIQSDIDEYILDGVLTEHETGLKVLCAANDPLGIEKLDAALMTRLIKALKENFQLVIIDTAPAMDVYTEAALAESDFSYLVTSLDLPAVKSAKVCLSTFDRLDLGTDRIRVILNRSNSNVGFPADEVGKALGKKIAASLPSDVSVPRSVNSGMPVTLDYPKSNVSKALIKLAADLREELMPTSTGGGLKSIAARFRPRAVQA